MELFSIISNFSELAYCSSVLERSQLNKQADFDALQTALVLQFTWLEGTSTQHERITQSLFPSNP